jgi:hypothetical protein
MTTFDKREQAFEAEFIHDEEIRFRALARCNKLLGDWAAAQLGLTGEAAAAYSRNLVVAELDHLGGEDNLHKVSKDLESKGISEGEVASKMDEFLRAALAQIKAGV